jgi:uncharacterized RDD family membrane protein YckC
MSWIERKPLNLLRNWVTTLAILVALVSASYVRAGAVLPRLALPLAQGVASTQGVEPFVSDTTLHLTADRRQLFAAFILRPPVATGAPAVTGTTAIFRRELADSSFELYSVVGGDVMNMSVYRGQLAVLLQSGEWRITYQDGYTGGVPPPTGLRLLRLAASDTSLFAIAYRKSQPNQPLRLLRLDAEGWKDVALLPAEISLTQPIDLLAVAGEKPEGVVHVYVATANAAGSVAVYASKFGPAILDRPTTTEAAASSQPAAQPGASSQSAASSQSGASSQPVVAVSASSAPSTGASTPTAPSQVITPEPEPAAFRRLVTFTPSEREVSQLRLLDVSLLSNRPPEFSSAAPCPALWVDPGKAGGGHVYFTRDASGADAAPPRSIDLGSTAGEVALFAERVRLFFQLERPTTNPIAAFLDPSNQIREHAFDPLTGASLGEPVRVRLPTAGVVASVTQFLFYFMIGGSTLLFYASLRRRGQIPNVILEAALRKRIAPPVRRLAAGVIDFIPVIVISGYLYRSVAPGEFGVREFFLLLVSYAAVVTHTLLAELIANRSLGQALMGLRLAGLDGRRPAPRAVVLRALAKIVELPTLYTSMVFSPLRQSLADAVTDMLVVETQPSAGVGSPPPAPPTGD